ncbi:hypothetical protein MRX96_031080 [Rhipicephalus microplus]
MANLKAGTRYTLVPIDEEQATVAAILTPGIAQTLAWGRTLEVPGEEVAANSTKEDITSNAFGLEQGMVNTFDAPRETEKPGAPLNAAFGGSEKIKK